MANASNVGPILQRIKAVEVDGNHRNARVVGDGVLARNVEVVMEKIGGRVNRLCGCIHPTLTRHSSGLDERIDKDSLTAFLVVDGLSFCL
jgi:hypothetical protein